MSDAKPQDRPRQLTMASWFVILGSVFLIASVYDSLTNLNSVDMRDQIGQALASGSGQGLGLGVDGAVSIMRVALLVAGACAAASAVLGVYVLQRHRQARIALAREDQRQRDGAVEQVGAAMLAGARRLS